MSKKEINERRSQLIRGTAELRGVDLSEMRRELGVTRQFFNRVINGQRRSDRVETAIARRLGITQRGMRI